MRYDLQLIRDLLLYLEGRRAMRPFEWVRLPGHGVRDTWQHMQLAHAAGLMEGELYAVHEVRGFGVPASGLTLTDAGRLVLAVLREEMNFAMVELRMRQAEGREWVQRMLETTGKVGQTAPNTGTRRQGDGV